MKTNIVLFWAAAHASVAPAHSPGTFTATGNMTTPRAMFALLIKYLPETKISWRQVLPGSVATAVLFTLGRVLIGIYLGKASLGSAYVAAGSLVVFIVWGLLFGAVLLLWRGIHPCLCRVRREPLYSGYHSRTAAGGYRGVADYLGEGTAASPARHSDSFIIGKRR